MPDEPTRAEPLPRDADYFAVLGLPRKLTLDPKALEPVYHELSRRYHPDLYRAATARERIGALESSSKVNQAYRTLRDPFERAAYLLTLEESTGEPAKDAPPQELFDEILEVQELLGEHRFADPEERESLAAALREKRDRLQAELDSRVERLTGELFRRWDALSDSGDAPERARVLGEIRTVLADRAYLRRVLNSLNAAVGAG
ncbi:MAG: Fe-S protein assembly co-chaperone HscB [Armatimonadota bacterium]